MNASVAIPAKRSLKREGSIKSDATTFAYNDLVKQIDQLANAGQIDNDTLTELKFVVKTLYLERLAEKHVEKRMNKLINIVNFKICGVLSSVMDPHKTFEHFNFNYKKEELRILGYDK